MLLTYCPLTNSPEDLSLHCEKSLICLLAIQKGTLNVFTCTLVSWLWSGIWSILVMLCTYKQLILVFRNPDATWGTQIETMILWHVNTFLVSEHSLLVQNIVTEMVKNQVTTADRQSETWTLLWPCIQGENHVSHVPHKHISNNIQTGC